MIEAEVCRHVFAIASSSKVSVRSIQIIEILFFFDRKTVQSSIHALMKAGLLSRGQDDEGFFYFIPKGVSKKEMEKVFETGTDFADIAALSPVPQSRRPKPPPKRTALELQADAVARAHTRGDPVLDSLEKIAAASRKAADDYKGKDKFVGSVLKEAASRSEEALAGYCAKLP